MGLDYAIHLDFVRSTDHELRNPYHPFVRGSLKIPKGQVLFVGNPAARAGHSAIMGHGKLRFLVSCSEFGHPPTGCSIILGSQRHVDCRHHSLRKASRRRSLIGSSVLFDVFEG